MPPLSRRLELLRVCDPVSRAAFLADAVAGAGADEVEPICRAAAASGDPDTIAHVLRHLHRLGETGAEIVCAAVRPNGAALASTLEPAITVALVDGGARTALNVIDVIACAAAPALGGPLARLLDADDEVARRAARTLLALVVAVVGPHGRAPARRLDRRGLDQVVGAALRTHRRHRQPAVLIAAALLADRPGPTLETLLAEIDHPAVSALRGLGGRTEEPLVRGNLVRWLGVAPLRATSRRWLHTTAGSAGGEVLADGHLLLAPRRQPALRSVERPLQCLPGLAAATGLPPRCQVGLPLLAARLDLSAGVRCRFLADLVALPFAPARLRAVVALLGQQGRRARIAVEPYCFDRVPAVARLAASAAIRDDPPERLRRLARDAPEPVARRAAARLAGEDVGELLARWRDLPDARRRAAAVRLHHRDTPVLAAGFRTALASPTSSDDDGRDAAALVVLARRLRLVPAIEDVLLESAARGPVRLVSTAIAALGDGVGDARHAVLLAALDHPNDRVRANAMEALARCPAPPGDRIRTSAVAAPANRLRANAVSALLRLEPGAGRAALLGMLGDANPLHRVSGLWVARRARAMAARAQIERLASGDPLPELRLRADAVLRFLTKPQRAAASGPRPHARETTTC